jgi:hypothetical protein
MGASTRDSSRGNPISKMVLGRLYTKMDHYLKELSGMMTMFMVDEYLLVAIIMKAR